MRNLIAQTWSLSLEAIRSFASDDVLSHAAAIAFYSVTALGPVLLIVVAVAGLGFGHEAAEVALSAQISGLMGPQSADLLRTALASASAEKTGIVATMVGIVTLFVTASGVFGEMQLSLNKIWKAPPQNLSVTGLVRARAAGLGLVAALGFLLLVSLAASAAISVLGGVINANLPFGEFILSAINGVVSFGLVTVLFAAIYKVLPDRSLRWRDVLFGAVVTAAMFTIGKSLIGWYIGTSAIGSSYGAAGSLLVVLLWIFYSAIIFLLGAEFTRAYSIRFGSRPDLVLLATDSPDSPGPQPARNPLVRFPLLSVSAAAGWIGSILLARMIVETRSEDEG